MAPATHNTHRTHVAFAWEKTAQAWTGTPTVDDEQQYAGTVYAYGPGGTQLASTAYDFTSDVDATAAEIITGILADLTGGDVDDYVTYSGTDTLIITCDSPGYSVVVTQTAGTLTGVYTGETAMPGTVPADATEWAAEGWRMYCEEADPSYILGKAAVENADMQPRVFTVQRPHKGLPTADGGSIVSRLWSTGGSYSAGTQLAETGLGKLLEHALGGSSRGNYTDVATVTNQYTFILTAATNMAIGQIVGVEDAGDAGRLWPAQILTKSSETIAVDRVQPFTVATSDKVYGAECAYPEQAALTNSQDSNYSTMSILYAKGPHVWVAGGAHLELQSMAIERGMQPKFTWGVNAARGYPQGDGAPSLPTFTDTIQSTADVQAIGYDTWCFLQTYGTTTSAHVSLLSGSITFGVPVLPQDSITQVDDGMPGRIGYRTEPAPTIAEFVVILEDTHQTRWTAGTWLTMTVFQVASVGNCWAFHMPKCFMAGPPVPANDGTNRWTIRVQATENDSTDATTDLAKAKFVFARY